MAPREYRHVLEDIREAIDEIERATVGKAFAEFQADWLLRHGVQRGIEIISEASRGIPEHLKATRPEIPLADRQRHRQRVAPRVPPRRRQHRVGGRDGRSATTQGRDRGHAGRDGREGVMMALTRSFEETVKARAARDPAFRDALLTEAADQFITGDFNTSKAVLRDYISATIGFERLAAETGSSSKSLMRMLSPTGNPTAGNLFAVLQSVQQASDVHLAVAAGR